MESPPLGEGRGKGLNSTCRVLWKFVIHVYFYTVFGVSKSNATQTFGNSFLTASVCIYEFDLTPFGRVFGLLFSPLLVKIDRQIAVSKTLLL